MRRQHFDRETQLRANGMKQGDMYILVVAEALNYSKSYIAPLK